MKARARHETEIPRYPTLLHARTTRGAIAAGLGALMLAPLAGCLEPLDASATPPDANLVAAGGIFPMPDAGDSADAGTDQDAGPAPFDAGSISGGAPLEDAGN